MGGSYPPYTATFFAEAPTSGTRSASPMRPGQRHCNLHTGIRTGTSRTREHRD
jgi:hypothetical protein